MGNMTIAQIYHWGAESPDVDGVKHWKVDEAVQQAMFTESMQTAKIEWINRVREAAGV
jgi:hypothetical protein